MKRIETKTKGPKGEARIRVGNGQVQITFKDDQSNPLLFKKSDVPEYVKAGQFYVSMSGDKEILSVRPINAIENARFAHFVAEEGEVPVPKEYPGGTARRKDGTTFAYDAYRAFIAILEITNNEYKGMTIPVFLRYLFVDDGEGNIAIKGSGKNAELVENFLEVSGVYDQDIPYSDNVLPKLQKVLLKRRAEFQVMLKAGNVDSFMELPEQDDNFDDDKMPEEEVLANDDFDDDDDVPF